MMRRRHALLVGMLIGVIGVLALPMATPFEGLVGSVSIVEYWSYDVEFRFGEPEEELTGHSIERYDRQGNQTETVHYDTTGRVTERYSRSFNDEGLLTRIDEFDGRGNLVSSTRVTYESGVRKHRAYDQHGNISSASDITLSPSGKTLTMVLYDEETGDLSLEIRNTYNDHDEPSASEWWNEDGERTVRSIYRYGVEGMDVMDETEFYVAGVLFHSFITGKVLAKRDLGGNWIEKLSYKREEKFGETEWILSNVYRRRIEYYE